MRPKRSLGQNFLVDPVHQRRIVDALDPRPDDEILEVGPGRGALTEHLVGRVRRLILVELDDDLAAELTRRWGGRDDVRIVHEDILEVDPADHAEDAAALRIVGNIPYNITTPILFHLLRRPRPAEILLMVQREVAERIVAEPGTGAYGALAVGVQSVADVARVLDVPRGAFRPVPRVDSSVVRVLPHDPPRLEPGEEERLRHLVRAAFQWRRKQFQKTLRDHPDLGLERSAVEELEARTGYDLRRRPETFPPAAFIRLSGLLSAT
ncbi:MAG: 16S rRNA (adenine(1518)-N(6)/adenine(1519)-N(6))-dimethyltransferase RsmA [Gemmatimonadota bacterium]